MSDRTKKYLSTTFNLTIYLAAGILAPYFFRTMESRRTAAVYAGGLFLVAALRAVRLSLTRPYPRWVQIFFGGLFVLELLFWFWRVSATTPLAAPWIHGGLSTLYLISCLVIITYEVAWLKKR